MHRFAISVTCAAALGLAGCMLGGSDKVAEGVSHAAQDEPAGAAQDTRQADGTDIPFNVPELSDFTTEGKPTTTIETHNGLIAIYKPYKDPDFSSNSILYSRDALLAAKKEDFLSLTKAEQEIVVSGRYELPNLSEGEWQDVLSRVSPEEWEVSLNQKTKAIRDAGYRGAIKYKHASYTFMARPRIGLKKSLDDPSLTTNDLNIEIEDSLCIDTNFRTIIDHKDKEGCIYKIYRSPVFEATSFQCKVGNEYYGNLPLVDDFGDVSEDELLFSKEHKVPHPLCKFQQRIMLYYPEFYPSLQPSSR